MLRLLWSLNYVTIIMIININAMISTIVII